MVDAREAEGPGRSRSGGSGQGLRSCGPREHNVVCQRRHGRGRDVRSSSPSGRNRGGNGSLGRGEGSLAVRSPAVTGGPVVGPRAIVPGDVGMPAVPAVAAAASAVELDTSVRPLTGDVVGLQPAGLSAVSDTSAGTPPPLRRRLREGRGRGGWTRGCRTRGNSCGRDICSAAPLLPVGEVGSWDRAAGAWSVGGGGAVPTLPRTVGPPTPRAGTPLRRGGWGGTGRGREMLLQEDPESDAREPDLGRVTDRGGVGRDGGVEVTLPNNGQLVDDGSEDPDTVLGSGGCHCLREGMDEKARSWTCHA